jgi:signal transduction histidine kinase
MTRHAQKLLAAYAEPPNIANVDVGQPVMWTGLLASGLPCALLLIVGIIEGRTLLATVAYAALLLLYLALQLLLAMPSRFAPRIWRHVWAYLLVVGLVCLALQAQTKESFLQPIVFLVPMIYASLVYPPVQAAAVGLCYLGLMNLGIWLSGERHPFAMLFPTFGYGTFMVFTYAFGRLSVQQAAARREADQLAADLARERDYLARLVEVTATLTRDLDLATVLEHVAAAGRTLAHAAHARVWLHEDDPDNTTALVRLVAAVPQQAQQQIAEIATLWNVESLQELPAVARGTALVLPLIFKGTAIGALEMRERIGPPFSDQDVRLLQPFADAAAVAIENARLYQQSHLSATLSERNRLARELHDTIAQGLTAVTMQLEAAQRSFERDPPRARARIARAHELARESLEDVRRSVWTLAAPLIDGHALPDALSNLTGRFTVRTGLPASYWHSGPPPPLSHTAATQVLRIVQEALQNVEKHAQATEVTVGSEMCAGDLRVWVHDNGVGFGPDQIGVDGAAGNGFGLVGMRERARLAGGSLQIESDLGAGTRIAIAIKT